MTKTTQIIGRVLYWLLWPVLWLYLRGSERTRVIVVSQGKVLFVKAWLGSGSWSLPGGGLLHDENPYNGAVRELHEETGILVMASNLRSLGTFWASQNGLRFLCHGFVLELSKSPKVSPRTIEIVANAWTTASQRRTMVIERASREVLTTWSAAKLLLH